MRSIIISAFLLLLISPAMAQVNYDASLIAKDLLPYASAVVRSEEITTEVKDLDNTIYHVKKAITVLNKNGDRMAHIYLFHDKINLIKYVKGTYFDGYGKQIGKFSESDFEDVDGAHDFSLFEDTRIKHYIPSVTTYPYTIAYEYELRSKQSLILFDWTPQEEGIAIENSTYTFICKPDFAIRYKEVNVPGKLATGTNKEGEKTYTWRLQNARAVKEEAYEPNPEQYLTAVHIAPVKFMYGGISGSFNNWNELGKWNYEKLLSSRTSLAAETVAHIKEITASITDPKMKAKRIYEYMQQKTHYISIQVGIGGYQPFFASDVDRLGYGDCKGLVNYTQALLKAADIDSWYCVVKSGRSYKVSMMDNFASMDQGDHIILCIPFKNDTTWAECTSQEIPFGFLGDFTDDRTVLACTPQGGKLMHTPKYTYNDNREDHKADFTIDDNGELSGKMQTVFKGTDYDDREGIIRKSAVERIKDIKRYYPINNLEIENLAYKQEKNIQPVTTESIKLSARDYASVEDNKMNFMINSVNRSSRPQRQIRSRLHDVDFVRGYTEDDEITYTLPKGYHLEREPLKMNITKSFGNYIATMTLNGDQLVYKRTLQLKDGTYSKDIYPDVADFFQDIYDADNYSVVLIKNKAN